MANGNGKNAFAAVFVSQELSGGAGQAPKTIDWVDQNMESLQIFGLSNTFLYEDKMEVPVDCHTPLHIVWFRQ